MLEERRKTALLYSLGGHLVSSQQLMHDCSNSCLARFSENCVLINYLGLHYSKKSREAATVGQVGSAASRSSLLLVHLVSTGIITREYRNI